MTVINQAWLRENLNPERTFEQRLTAYLSTNLAVFREVQLVRGIAKVFSEIPSSFSESSKEILEHANQALSLLSLVGLRSTTRDLLNGVDQIRDFRIELLRKVGILFKEVIGNFTPWLSAGMFLSGNPIFKNALVFTGIASDVSDLGMALSDYWKAAQLEAEAEGESKLALTHSKNYYLLKSAKVSSAFIGKALAIAFVYAGVTVVSTVALNALSLFSLSLTVRTELYKEEGRYKVIKFDCPVTLEKQFLPAELHLFQF